MFDSLVSQIIARTGHTPTNYQVNLYRFLWEEDGNCLVNAVAGSGKTTTLIDALNFCRGESAIMVAFNKHIAEELNSRGLPGNAEARTLHSVGFAALRKAVKGRVRVDNWKVKKTLQSLLGFDSMGKDEKKEFWGMFGSIKKMVSLLKNFGFGAHRPSATLDDINALVNHFGVDVPDISPERYAQICLDTLEKGNKDHHNIDFDDMLYLPVMLGAPLPKYRFVFCDESQDLNPIQIEIVRQMSQKGRAVFVGDRNQAIYGFRGADVEAMNTILEQFNAVELPLSICWRCPTSVVAAAQAIVPQIEASPVAGQGSVGTINEDTFNEQVSKGDYVLCRTTAPLVHHCLRQIRMGNKAIVRGRDIGEGLVRILGRISSAGLDGSIVDQIEEWGRLEGEKFGGPTQASRKATLDDQIATLLVLTEGARNFSDIEATIKRIFQDSDTGIVFCTIHRSKGLEAERIFCLKPELLPHPAAKLEWELVQEANLKYVAITRSQKELYWVEK
jgi:DNA helicase-2/ATP-dependent DNA helicase PcrA